MQPDNDRVLAWLQADCSGSTRWFLYRRGSELLSRVRAGPG